jgi:transglutaminase-like putative cysteine protease
MTQATLNASATTAPAAPRPRFKYLNNVYFQDGLLLTTLLSALLYLVLAVSMDAAGHVESGMGLVVPVTFGAIVLGTLMSYSRFDSFFALSHALFTGLALILFMMTRLPTAAEIAPFLDRGLPELQARAYFVLLRLLNWVDAAISGSASADNYVFIFEIAFLLWWLAFLGMWSILRYGYLWRAVVPAGLALVINAYYAPQPIWALLAIFSVLALFLLVRAHLAEQQLRWRDQRVHVTHEVGWDFARTGMTYSLIVLTLAWMAPGLGRNVQIRQMLAPLNERWEQTSQDINRLYQGLNRRELASNGTFGRSLTLGGERNVGDSLLFNVATAQGRYWRAVVFDTYTGKGWLNTNETQVLLPSLQPAPIADWSSRTPLTQTVTLMAPSGNVVFGVPDVRQLDMPVDVLISGVPAPGLAAPPLVEADADGVVAPSTVEFSMVRTRRQLESGDTYTLLSNVTDVSQLDMENAPTEYPPEIMDRYLQIPEDFSPRVTELAQSLTLTATTPYAKAKAIEDYLRTIPYDDAIAAPPPDADPIEYFLFTIREGYCDYYATSMAMMLRTQGVPARTASGYAEGIFDDESLLYFVSERDAHTWVEVFFPGLGWVEFEPTAAESPLNRPTGMEDPNATLMQENVEPTPDPNQPQRPDEPLPQQDPGAFDPGAQGEGSGGPAWWVWALLTPVVLIAGLLLIRRVQSSGPTAFTPDLPIILFERLQRWGARIGIAPQASETPYEQANAWSRRLPDGAPPIRRITRAYVLQRFGGRQPQPAPPVPGARQPGAEDWATLQPLFVRAWAERHLPFLRRRNVYDLEE